MKDVISSMSRLGLIRLLVQCRVGTGGIIGLLVVRVGGVVKMLGSTELGVAFPGGEVGMRRRSKRQFRTSTRPPAVLT